jgi:hypothetical protein
MRIWLPDGSESPGTSPEPRIWFLTTDAQWTSPFS